MLAASRRQIAFFQPRGWGGKEALKMVHQDWEIRSKTETRPRGKILLKQTGE